MAFYFLFFSKENTSSLKQRINCISGWDCHLFQKSREVFTGRLSALKPVGVWVFESLAVLAASSLVFVIIVVAYVSSSSC